MPEAQIVEKKETVEVLDSKGNTMDHKGELASIFDRIESAKDEGKTAKEAIADHNQEKVVQKQQKVQQEPKEEKVEKPQVKTDLEKTLDDTQARKDEESGKTDDPREALRRSTEKKKEVEKVEKKEPEKVESVEKKDDEVTTDELAVLPHDKPKTAKRIQKLLDLKKELEETVSTTRAEAKEKADKLVELEKKLGEVKTVDPKTQEQIDKDLGELKMLRRRYVLDNDPEVKTKFDGRIEGAEKSISETLVKHGATEPILKLIKDAGGWTKFADSTMGIKLADGKTVSAAEFAEMIMGDLPIGSRKGIEAAMMEQVQLTRDRERFFKEEQEKAGEFFKKQEEEKTKQTQEQEGKVKEYAGKIEKWHKDVLEKNDWLKEKPIPSNATAEQKAALEEENKYTKQLNTLLVSSLGTRDLDKSLEIVMDSVRFYQERREKASLLDENAKLKADLKAKQTEIDKIRGSNRTTPKGGSIAGGGSVQSKTPEEKKAKSLDEAFDRIQAGRNPDGDDE